MKTMENHQIIVADLTVRFRDVDAMGHVNNAVFLTYFEEGRSAFLARVLEIVDPSEYPFILARISCDYLRPLKLGDRIAIQVWIGRVGKKSFVFKYRIVNRGDPDAIYAAGESTMVLFDYKENRTVPIGPAFLERVQAYCEEL
ncbi:Thioesterase superfamily protein [uncultured Desulfatiglans sp.]|nr:Thioesterase superfamily protein [uncultured Desulfatiglans sp.]